MVKMSPFKLLFGGKQATPDAFVPSMYNSEESGGLDPFVQQRRNMHTEVKDAPVQSHRDSVERRTGSQREGRSITCWDYDEARGPLDGHGDNITLHSSSNMKKLEHKRSTSL